MQNALNITHENLESTPIPLAYAVTLLTTNTLSKPPLFAVHIFD